jgi:hypothetical protein
MVRECLLDNTKECNDCGKCEICDVDPSKLCDNCCRCLGDADFNGIEITEIVLPAEVKLKRKKGTAISPKKKNSY